MTTNPVSEKDQIDWNATVIFDGSNVEEWFRFDRQVLRFVKKEYGDYGIKLWNGTTIEIDANSVEAIANDTYESMVKIKGRKEADINYWSVEFWTVDWQQKWRDDAVSSIRDYVESRTRDKAFRFLTELDNDDWPMLRSKLQKEYARATAAKIKVLEMEYDLGLVAQGQQAFPPGVNMEEKLYALNQRRTRLWFLAPEHLRKDYRHGKSEYMVRIILNHLTDMSYLGRLDTVIMMHKFKLQQQGINVPEDTQIENYSDEWLPAYKDVKENLLSTYETIQLSEAKSTGNLPVLSTTEKQTSGGGMRPCWGCGQPGHRRGDPLCRQPNAIHESAPQHIKEMHAKGTLRAPGAKPAPKDKNNEICRNHQKGYCRFGSKCYRKHDGGGGNGGGGNGNNGKGGRKQNASAFADSVLISIKDKLHNARKQSKKKNKRQDSDSDSGSDDNGQEDLLALLTTATRKSKKGRLMMMAGGGLTLGDGGNVRALAELHSKDVTGVDTDASRFVTTDRRHMIPSLLNTSPAMCDKITFSSAAGTTRCIGVGPGGRYTNETSTRETVAIIDPQGVLLEKLPGGNDITVYAQQRLKSLGLPLTQCYNGTDDDVLICQKTGMVINLTTENGILVLKTTKRQASQLSKITNLDLLIDDIANKRTSPIVPLSMKHYVQSALATKSCRTLPAQLNAQLGNLGATPSVVHGSSDSFGIDTDANRMVSTDRRSFDPMPSVVHGSSDRRSFDSGAVRSTSSSTGKRAKIGHLTSPVASNSNWVGRFQLLLTTEKNPKFVVMAFNEAKLTGEQLARLWHFRLLHKSARKPVDMHKKDLADGLECTHILNEPCPICDGAKFRTKAFPRNDLAIKQKLDPWEKVYFDGYGGLGSMGCKSYDGAIGGFIFVCARSNAWQKYLYSSEAQLPAILKRFFLWIELQKFKLRLLICDPKAVNISSDIEELCDENGVVLRPASTNTPEEIAMAEKAVGDLRRDSRAAMQSAPHLPDNMWGCADAWSVWVHYVTQSASNDGGLSPYQVCEGRKPHMRTMLLHVFGCPVAMKPPSKKHKDSNYQLHLTKDKNKPVTIYGWFVGVLWPRVLALRKADKKIVAVSRKKVIWYEAIYCLPPHVSPITRNLVSIEPLDKDMQYIPKAVQSIKVAAEKAGLHMPTAKMPKPTKNDGRDNTLESSDLVNQGETFQKFREDNFEIETAQGQELIEGIRIELAKKRVEPALRAKLIEATKKHVAEKDMTEIRANELKAHIKAQRRKERNQETKLDPREKPVETSDLPTDVDPGKFIDDAVEKTTQTPLYQQPCGTRVAIETKRFDAAPGSYSKGKSKYTQGTLKKKGKAGVMYVQWDGDESLTKSHWKHLPYSSLQCDDDERWA